jgi:hypothetical protein
MVKKMREEILYDMLETLFDELESCFYPLKHSPQFIRIKKKWLKR